MNPQSRTPLSPLYCVPLFYCRHRGLWPNPWPLFMARNASIQAGGIKPNRCGIITLPTTRLASGIGCFALQEATILFLNGLCMAFLVVCHLCITAYYFVNVTYLS